jgi:hypothetical protein
MAFTGDRLSKADAQKIANNPDKASLATVRNLALDYIWALGEIDYLSGFDDSILED